MFSWAFGCPCGDARVGALCLTMCVYSALHSSAFFGTDFASVLAQAAAGDATTGMVVWAAVAAAGLYWFRDGVREALSQRRPIPAYQFRMVAARGPLRQLWSLVLAAA